MMSMLFMRQHNKDIYNCNNVLRIDQKSSKIIFMLSKSSQGNKYNKKIPYFVVTLL